MTKRQKIAAYQDRLFDILSASNDLDNNIILKTKELSERLRSEIIGKTVEVLSRMRDVGGIEPEWGIYWMPRLLAEYEQVIQSISEAFRSELENHVTTAYGLGFDLADSGIELSKPGASEAIPRPSQEQVKLASSFSGDMITSMQEKQLQAISKVLSSSMARGDSPMVYLSKLNPGIDSPPWSITYHRAEVIARTESARVQELARRHRLIQHERANPEVKQYSQYLCEPRGMYPCKKCASYDGNVYDVNGKLFLRAPGKSDEDMPTLPIHPNCLCSYTVYVPSLSMTPGEEYSGEEELEPDLCIVEWKDFSFCWIVTLPNGMGHRSIQTLSRASKNEEIIIEAKRLVSETGVNPESIEFLVKRPGDLSKPDLADGGRKPKRAIEKVLGRNRAKKLIQSHKEKRPK